MSGTKPHLARRDIESIDEALNELREAINLPRRDPRRPEAAANLARIGFSVPQIVTLSKARWPRQSVKRWVEGIKAAGGAPAERAVGILVEAVEKDLTFENLNTGLTFYLQLLSQGVTPEEVLEFLSELREQQITLSECIQHYKSMKDSGLTFADIKRHLEYKESLEEEGFGLDSLRLIADAAHKYNENPDDILTAIDSYETIQKVKAELGNLRQSKSSEENRFASLNQAVTELESKRTELQTMINENVNTLQQLDKVMRLGYNLESLMDLERRTTTLGGISKFLTAVAKYDELAALQDDIGETRQSLAQLEAQRTKMETDNLHLRAHIDATRKLIDVHKLGLEAIQDILDIAKKYGPPEAVFKAFRSIDTLGELEIRVKGKAAQLKELGDKERELTDRLNLYLPEIEKKLLLLQQAFEKDIETTKTNLNTELNSLLKAVYEAGKAYQEVNMRAKESEPYMELLDLVSDPKSVSSSRVLDTLEAILTKMSEWIKLNETVFKHPMDLSLIQTNIRQLIEKLRRAERTP